MKELCVGQRVRALVEMVDDQTDEGAGIQLCARKGDELIVRKVPGGKWVIVSHPNVTDGRGFCVSPDEVEVLE